MGRFLLGTWLICFSFFPSSLLVFPMQIAGNIAGATIGGFFGLQTGRIRDAKGKAVYKVFTDLAPDQKAQILKALAVKVFGMTGIADNFK
jgi:hypothetical protein